MGPASVVVLVAFAATYAIVAVLRGLAP